jgi:hypothetical protein
LKNDGRFGIGAGRGDRDFGPEAIEALMLAMNHRPGVAPVMIFAGYKDAMGTFLSANIGTFVEKYRGSIEQMVEITPVCCFGNFMKLPDFFGRTGIERRIGPGCQFDFEDYNCTELAQIFIRRAAQTGFGFEVGVTEAVIAEAIRRGVNEYTRSMMNAGLWEHLYRHAKSALNGRSDPANPLCDFSEADVRYACGHIVPIVGGGGC